MYIRFHVKYPLFLSDFNVSLIFSTDFRKKKNTRIPNFMKIRPLGAEWFHADGQTHKQTDMTKLTVILRNSANAPTKIHCFEDTMHLLLQAVNEIRHVIRRHGIRDLSFSHLRCWKISSSGMWCYVNSFVFFNVSIHLVLYPETESTAVIRKVR